MNVVIRAGTDRAALASGVKQQIRAIDSYLPLYNVRTMEQRLEESLARRRFSMLVLTLFACVALALATVGTYGVMAYLMNQGRREIGIRIALGATRTGIIRLVVWRGMALALSGVTVGLGGAFALSRLLRSLLFGVNPTDPLTFVAIALLLAIVTLLASYVQAHRAAHIDPIVSLRYE